PDFAPRDFGRVGLDRRPIKRNSRKRRMPKLVGQTRIPTPSSSKTRLSPKKSLNKAKTGLPDGGAWCTEELTANRRRGQRFTGLPESRCSRASSRSLQGLALVMPDKALCPEARTPIVPNIPGDGRRLERHRCAATVAARPSCSPLG